MTAEEKFRPIARLVKQQLRLCLLRERPLEATRAVTRLANDLACLIVDTYHRFDRGKFLGACGIDDEMLEGCGLPPLGKKAGKRSEQKRRGN